MRNTAGQIKDTVIPVTVLDLRRSSYLSVVLFIEPNVSGWPWVLITKLQSFSVEHILTYSCSEIRPNADEVSRPQDTLKVYA